MSIRSLDAKRVAGTELKPYVPLWLYNFAIKCPAGEPIRFIKNAA
jgi:hypothetical protein